MTKQLTGSNGQDARRLIYLLLSNELGLLEKDLMAKLEQAGYYAKHFACPDSITVACEAQSPAAIIVDTQLLTQYNLDSTQLIDRLKLTGGTCPPVILLAASDDIDARLDAVQSGASRYFTTPLDVAKLIQTLDSLTSQPEATSYRVLLVDDDKARLESRVSALSKVGLDVDAQLNPTSCLSSLERFNPDLILLAIDMAECSGPKLAKLIRLDDDWAQKPISLLATQSSFKRQLPALNLDSNDSLILIENSEQLAASVIANLKRLILNKELQRTRNFRLNSLNLHALLSITDHTGRIIEVNDKFSQLSGYAKEELLGQPHNLIKSGHHPASFYTELWATITQGKVWQGVVCNRTKNGDSYWVESTIYPVLDDAGKPYQYISLRTDITQLKIAEAKTRRNYQLQLLLGDILNASFKDIPLKQVLQQAIDSIIDTALISTQRAGSIFLADKDSDSIILTAERGLDPALLKKCGKLSYGTCHCGKAASTRKIQFSDCIDHQHEIHYDGMEPHGHYCLPIERGSTLLGVLNVYIEPGHQATQEDRELLRMISYTLAGVIDRKQTEQSLLEARKEAENANHAKSQFLSNMSHELRTPMNAIMGFGQLLGMQTTPALTTSQQESVNEITKAADHLLKLINQVLDLAQIESGNMALSIESVALSEVIAESLQLITPQATKRGIEVQQTEGGTELNSGQLAYENITVRADRIRLRQTLINLLSNAVKYNNKNGTIRITCEQKQNKQTRISITDTGEGISLDEQWKLFKPFTRLGDNQATVEGTGIGLAISKNIVEQMDGNIGVISQPGEGSTFWIELPTDTTLVEQMPITDNNQVSLIASSSNSHPEPEMKQSVLYIEDNPANLRLVKQLLERIEHIDMLSAHEPMLGLELATEHKPDLILLDINLPGMDGFGVLSQLRQREETQHIPVIAISANAMPNDIEKGLTAGFDEYITKPINIIELFEIIETRLSSS